MKQLIEYINESFSCSVLQELNKQLSNIQIKDFNDWSAAKKENYQFNRFIAISGYYNIRWDKITDADFQKGSGDDPKLVKRIKSACRQGGKESLFVFCKTKDNKFFDSIIITDNRMIGPIPHEMVDYPLKYYSHNNFKIDTIGDAVKNSGDVYILDLDKSKHYMIQTNDKDSKWSRRESREGMVLQGDVEYYKKVAKDNINRYKDIIKTKAAQKLDDDDLIETIKNTLDKSYEALDEMVRNPYVEGTTFYNIARFSECVSGVFKKLQEYSDKKRDVSKGNYTFQNPKKALEELKDACTRMETILNGINL